MLCSPPPATTLASSCAGSEGFCAPCCWRSSQRSRIHNRPKTGRTLLLHERLHSILASGYPALIIFRTASGDEHVVTAFGYTHNPDEWRSEGVNAYLRSAPIVPYYPSTQWVDHFLVHDDNVGPYYTIDISTVMDFKVSTVIGLTPPDVRSYPAMVEMAAAEALKSILGQVPDSVWGRRLQRYPLILRTTLRSREEYRSHLKNLVGYDKSRLTPDELTWVD